MQRLFRQFSFPGGIPSHVAPETPGLDPRGRRARLLAGARLRRGVRQPRPDRRLRGRRRRGRDRPAGHRLALATSSSTRPRDGAVLPILHLNGYKIANPTVLARIPRRGAGRAARRLRLRRRTSSTGDDPDRGAPAAGRDAGRGARRDRGDPARAPATTATQTRPRWPMIVLRRPRAGPGPRSSTACRWRAPGAPTRCRSPRCAPTPSTCASSRSGCAATGRRSCSTPTGRCVPELAALAPGGRPPDERQPARQRRPAAAATWTCPTSATTRSTVAAPGAGDGRGDPGARRLPARRDRSATRTQLPAVRPGRDRLQPAGSDVFEVTDRAWRRRDRSPTTTTSRPTAG